MKIDMKELKARIKSESFTLKALNLDKKTAEKSLKDATKAFDKQAALVDKLKAKLG